MRGSSAAILVFAGTAWGALGCVPSFPTKTGDTADATTQPHDGSSACATRGTGTVGTIGCECTNSGALGCSGNDSTEQIICSPGHVWDTNGPCTGGGTRCASAGPSTGTCQPVVPLCADASPGDRRCTTSPECHDGGAEAGTLCTEATAVVSCGDDLLTTTTVASCTGKACVNGACTGNCVPGTSECGDGGQIMVCGAAGVNASTTCAGQCSTGHCAVTWSPDENATAITINDTDVYWIDGIGASPALWTASLSTGIPRSLYSAGGASLLSLAIDATAVYFTAEQPHDGGATTYAVLMVSFAGNGTPLTLASPTAAPFGLAADTYNVYWADGATSVVKAPVQGGATTTLATGQAVEGLALDPSSGSLYWINNTSPGGDTMGAVVESVHPRTGGMPITIATPVDPVSLAVYDGSVFWTSSSGQAVVSRSAGGSVTTLATNLNLPYDSPGIAANGTTVAWITRQSLTSLPLNGAPRTAVVSYRPEALAMSGAFLVWAGSYYSPPQGVFGQAPP